MNIVKLNETHLKTIFEWRNWPSVRKGMINDAFFTFEQHLQWFENLKTAGNQTFYYISEKTEGVGVVYFTETAIEGQIELGFYKNPGHEKVKGSDFVAQGIMHHFRQRPFLKLISHVKSDNLKSLKLHENLGFSVMGVSLGGCLSDNQYVDLVYFEKSDFSDIKDNNTPVLSKKSIVILCNKPDLSARIFVELKSLGFDFSSFSICVLSSLVELEELDNANVEFVFCLFFSEIIKKEILDKFVIIGFHCAEAHIYRGGSPIQRLIEAGYRETNLMMFQMEESIDDGQVISIQKIVLSDRSLTSILYTLTQNACKMMLDFTQNHQVQINRLVKKDPPYPKAKIGFRRKEHESSIDLKSYSSFELLRFIRMLDHENYPRANVKVNDLLFTFSRSVSMATSQEKMRKFITIAEVEDYE